MGKATIPHLPTNLPPLKAPPLKVTIPHLPTNLPPLKATIPHLPTNLPPLKATIPHLPTNLPPLQATQPLMNHADHPWQRLPLSPTTHPGTHPPLIHILDK